MPRLGAFVEKLTEKLERDKKLPKRQRRTTQKLFQELQLMGYEGGYDSVSRYVKRWRQKQSKATGQVFIPLSFDPGDAFQFDWSHKWVQMAGMPVKAKFAHIRLCHRRMFLIVAYPRETQEMVFDAHEQAFDFFGGICRRGIYDNLKTVVNKILSGKEVVLNLLYRAEDEEPMDGIDIDAHLHLECQPVADCGRYDWRIKEAPHAAQ